jgi:hypothetical protein
MRHSPATGHGEKVTPARAAPSGRKIYRATLVTAFDDPASRARLPHSASIAETEYLYFRTTYHRFFQQSATALHTGALQPARSCGERLAAAAVERAPARLDTCLAPPARHHGGRLLRAVLVSRARRRLGAQRPTNTFSGHWAPRCAVAAVTARTIEERWRLSSHWSHERSFYTGRSSGARALQPSRRAADLGRRRLARPAARRRGGALSPGASATALSNSRLQCPCPSIFALGIRLRPCRRHTTPPPPTRRPRSAASRRLQHRPQGQVRPRVPGV